MKKIITLLILIVGFFTDSKAQLLLDQCESLSPCNARAICGTGTIVNPYSFTTTATTGPINTCSGGTPLVLSSYSTTPDWVYYRFTCFTTGFLNFRLMPHDSATTNSDLDWAIWDISTSGCGSLGAGNLVECNAGVAGATGISGTPNANFENTISIVAGSTYILGISNNSITGNHGGFTINFAGTTASITDNRRPYLTQVAPFDPCSPVSTVKVKISEPVRCDQLNAVNGEFTITGPSVPSYTVTAVGCSGCTNAAPNNNPNYYGNGSDSAQIVFATALAPGNYTITPIANAWRDLCANADSVQISLTFSIPAPFKDTVRSGFDCINLKYVDTVCGLNGLSPYQYKATGGGLPASAGIFGPSTPGCAVYAVSGGSAVTYTIRDANGCEQDTVINRPSVIQLQQPNLSLSASPPCNNQFALDSIYVSSQSGGQPPYSFSLAPTYPWTFTPPAKWKGINFSPAAAVAFTVTVTDALGCTRTGVRNMVNPSLINLTLGAPTNPLCFGDSNGRICFNQATGGTPGSPVLYTYGLNPTYPNVTFTTTPNICFNNLPAGIYTVTAQDANGCTVTGTRTLTQPLVNTINTSAATITHPTCPNNCNGRIVTISTGGTGAKKYYLLPYVGPGPWDYTDSVTSTIPPNNDFDTLCAGTYTVIVRDALNCTSSATFTLALPPSPTLNLVTVNPVPCFGGTGNIQVNVTGGQFPPTAYTSASYSFQPATPGMTVTASGVGNVNATYNNVPQGTYNLIITNNNACADTLFNVNMTQPASPLGYSSVVVDSVDCFGTATGSITVQASGGTVSANSYQYAIKIGAAPFSAFTAPTLLPHTFNSLAVGTYTIRARDHNNCLKDTIVSIFQPTRLNLLLDHVTVTCFGTSAGEICVIDTGGTPGYEYKLGVAGLYSPVQPAGSVYCFSGLAAGNYSVFTRDSKGCLDTLAVNVAAIPLPVVSFTATPNDTVCDGTQITLCGTGADTYSWTGGLTDCTAFLPALGASSYTVTGTQTFTGCQNTAVVNVLVNPIPVMTPVSNQAVCNNAPTTAINFNSSVSGSSFNWSHDGAGIGLVSPGTGNIPSFVAINTGNTPLVVTFTVTPVGPGLTACQGTPFNFTLTINPTPVLTDPLDQQICAGDNTADVIFVSSVNNTTFSWTNNNITTGLASFSGTGNILSFVGLNPGSAPNISLITVTPFGPAPTACPGSSESFTITVDPEPVLIAPADQTICNGQSSTAVNLSTLVAGTTFSWTNDQPGIGLPAAGNGNIPAFTAINTGIVPITANICITPSGPNPTNCLGNQVCFTITVNPTPTINAIADQTLCAGDNTLGILFGGAVAGTQFTWTNSEPLIGLAANSGGAVAGIPSFVAQNTGAVTLTGTIIVSTLANGCAGARDTFTINVNPIPIITPVINQSLCEGDSTSPINFNINVASSQVSWSYSASANIGLPFVGNGNIPSFTAINTGTTPIVATFTVTPTGPSPTSCPGNDITFTITVLPRQQADFSYSSGTYCQTGINPLPVLAPGTAAGGVFTATPAGLALNPVTGLINLAGSSLGLYTVTYTTPGPCLDSATFAVNITLAPTAGFGYGQASYCQSGINPAPVFNPGAGGGVFSAAPAGLDINPASGVINLSTSAAGTYTVTNFIAAAGGCAAASATTIVTIDSIPVLDQPADQNACNNLSSALVTFSSSIAGSTYSWTHNGGASIGIATSGTGNIPTFTTINTGNVPLIVTFTVTPTSPLGCPGQPLTFTMTINPTPVANDPPDQIVCAGDSTAPVIFSANMPCTFDWFNSNPAIGLAASGTGNIPSFVATNPGTIPISGTITVYPLANGCVGGPQTFTITVNPLPAITNPGNQSFCNGVLTPVINLNTPVAGSTINWTCSNPAIGLASSGTGNIPSFTATNPGNTPIVATICATATGPFPTFCVGAQICFDITINPTPDVDSLSDLVYCAGDASAVINFSGGVAGTQYTWSNTNTGIGLPANSGGLVTSIPSFTTSNTGNAPIIGVIVVTPQANGCQGPVTAFSIEVDPIPDVDPVPDQQVCDGENTTLISFTGQVANTDFNWSYSASANIGLAFNGSGDIPSFTAVNTGTVPVVATFTVTPTGPAPSSCAGADLIFTITVLPRQQADFNYPLSTYCQTGTNPSPVLLAGTTPGGTFSATPAGLSLNPVTGVINLSASTLSTYTVSYTTPGPCPDTATFVCTISVAPTAGFGYPQASYCQSGIAPSPVFAPGASAGVFSALPAGLSINATTGVIDLNNSLAGIYTVTNFIAAAGGCASATANTVVTIDSSTVIAPIANQTVCNGDNTIAVNPVGSLAGTTTAWSHNGASFNGGAGIGIAASGVGNIPAFTAINTGTTPITATFTVTATGPAPQNCPGASVTFTITIDPTPTVNFLSNVTACTNTNVIVVAATSPVAGCTFSWTNTNPAIGLAASGTGPIPIFVATNSGGTPISGTICVTATGPAPTFCVGPTTCFTITVNPNATVSLTSGSNNQTPCINSAITPIVYTIGGTGNNATAANLPPGVNGVYNAGTFTISGSPTTAGNYVYTVTATGSCGPATATGTIQVSPLQNPTFLYPNPTNCQFGTTQPIAGSIATPGGTFSATPAGIVWVNTTTGIINLAASTVGSYTIKYVTPGLCKDSAFLNITITNAPSAEFSYAASSYCQSAPQPCPIFITPPSPNPSSAGVFSSIPAGVVFGAGGCINLAASTPGAYQIINTILASGACPQVADTFNLTIVSKPVLSFVSSTNAGCNPNCNGTVTTSIVGGTGTYTCSIAPGGSVTNAGFASNLCAGTVYTITATDAIGCTGTITVSVVTAPAPVISLLASTNTTIPGNCDGTATTGTVGGTPGYTYSISGPGTPLISGLGIATNLCGDSPCVAYTIIVTDLLGCKDTVDACIGEPGLLQCASSFTAVSCPGGSNGTLKAWVSGGTDPYSFVSLVDALGNPVPYTPAAPIDTIYASGLAAGTYVATWADSNNVTCNSVIVITQPIAIGFVIDSIYTPTCFPPNPSCDGTLQLHATGGTGTMSYAIVSPVGMTCNAVQGLPGNFTQLGVGTYTIIATDGNGCTASTTVQINPSPIPTLSLTGTNPSCHNVCDGSIVAVGSGGTGALSYAITPPPGSTCVPQQLTSGNFSSLGGGNYLIVVTDTKGCNTSSSVNLVNPPVLNLNPPASTPPACFGDCNASITLSGTGGTGPLTYTIALPLSSNTTGVFNGLCSGTYTVSITDSTNCSVTATVQINDPTQLTWVTANAVDIICAGQNNGVINTLAGGGTGLKQYSLNGAPFTPVGNFTSLPAGTYTVTARDANNCTISTSFVINEPPVLVPGVPVVSNVLCNGGNTGSITITASGGVPGYSFSITPFPQTNTTGVFNGLTAAIYAITITDSIGCSKTVTNIVVSQPAPLVYTLVNHQDVACFGDATGSITVSTQGGTGLTTYSIIPNVGTQGPSGFFNNLTAGTYTLIATDANNCVIATTVIVNQGPQLIFANISTVEPICHGDSNGRISFTVFGGTGQLRFSLDGGPLQTDTFFNSVYAGPHILTVVDALGCTASVNVLVTEPEPVGAILDLDEANCIDSKDGRAVIIGTGGRGGYKYYITPGLYINKSGIFTNLAPGTYLLRVVDTSGCEYRTTFTINPPANPLGVSITKKDLGCHGVGNEGSATANVSGGTPPYTYLWSTEPPQTTATANTLYFGYYDITIVDANGCLLKDTVYIEEGPCCDVAFIPNAFSPNGDQVNDEFRVLTTAGVELVKLEIYNRWGQRVWSTIDYRRGWDGRYDGKDAPVDTYYYILRYVCTRDGKTYTKKGDVILIR